MCFNLWSTEENGPSSDVHSYLSDMSTSHCLPSKGGQLRLKRDRNRTEQTAALIHRLLQPEDAPTQDIVVGLDVWKKKGLESFFLFLNSVRK